MMKDKKKLSSILSDIERHLQQYSLLYKSDGANNAAEQKEIAALKKKLFLIKNKLSKATIRTAANTFGSEFMASIPKALLSGNSNPPADPVMGDNGWKILTKRETFDGGIYDRYMISNSNGKFWILEKNADQGDPDHIDYYFLNSKNKWEPFTPTPYQKKLDELKFIGGKCIEYTAYTVGFSMLIVVEVLLTKGQITKSFWGRFLANATIQGLVNKAIGALYNNPEHGELANIDIGDAVLQSVDIAGGSAMVKMGKNILLKIVIPALQDISLKEVRGPVKIEILGVEHKELIDIGIDAAFNALAMGVDLGNIKLKKGFNIEKHKGDAPVRAIFDATNKTINTLNYTMGEAIKKEIQ